MEDRVTRSKKNTSKRKRTTRIAVAGPKQNKARKGGKKSTNKGTKKKKAVAKGDTSQSNASRTAIAQDGNQSDVSHKDNDKVSNVNVTENPNKARKGDKKSTNKDTKKRRL